ncbi:MAG: hypothetical protein JNL58_16295 [Planctomyces sp.]|nr:hypothetical protein [Planctomyces sp.]
MKRITDHQNADDVECVLVDERTPRSGMENMQIDERLLENGASRRVPIVRIYRWKEPTISLGYFQPADVEVEDRWAACPRVRRLSGGGAILHDREITYSVVIPSSHELHRDPYSLYARIHRAIIHQISIFGGKARLRSDAPFEKTEEGFLCFLRRDPNDVVSDVSHEEYMIASADPAKIVGSAQRRRRGTVLQHGSLLMRSSELGREIPGICDLYPEFDATGFESSLGKAICESLELHRICQVNSEEVEEFRNVVR